MKKRIVYAAMVVLLVTALTISTVGADSAVPIDTIDWEKVVQHEENNYTLQPDQIVYTDDGIGVDAFPVPISPAYETTYKKKPIFYFTRDYAATKYSIGVYDDYYSTFVYAGYPDKGTCTSYYCYIRPDVKLEPAGLWHSGYYEWDVISKVGGYWQTWSAWAPFRVMLKKFNDTFDLPAVDWYNISGDWFWSESKGRLKGYAANQLNASLLRDGYFYDVDYTVMMKRKDNASYGNAIIIAGDPNPLEADLRWYKGIYFQYDNIGNYSIFKDTGGSWSYIQNWTSSSAINKYGWNELRIAANYPYFDVWINGTYLGWWYDDTAPYGGYTGVAMLGDSVYDHKLIVDYAMATAIQYTALAEHDPAMQLGLETVQEGTNPNIDPTTLDSPQMH